MLTPLPNPDTYLNHFPPALVTQFEAARDLAVVVLGVKLMLTRNDLNDIVFCRR